MDSRPNYQSSRHRDERRRHDGRNTYRQPRERFPSRDSSRDSIASSIPYSFYRRDRNYLYHSPRRNYSPSPVRRISRGRYYHHSPRREYSPYRGYRRASDRSYDHGRRYRTPSASPPRSVRFRNMPRDSLSPIRRRHQTYRNTIPNTSDDTDDERFNAYMSDDSFTLLSHPEHHQSLLMTVKGHIRNEETGTLQPVNIMLDSGAQTSFITKDAASRLSLQPEDTRPLTIVGFGGHKSSEESGTVTTKLIDKSNRPLPNRVNQIRTILTYFTSADIQTKFYYVQSEVNPADCATRGLSTKEGKNHIWWQGPPFLRKPPSEWPKAETEFALPPDMGSEAEYEFRAITNRVNQIRTILTNFTSADIQTKFYYVQSEVNPADCATRGLSTKEGKNHIWWQGPPFLCKPPSEWPKAETEFALPPDMGSEAEYEFRAITGRGATSESCSDLHAYFNILATRNHYFNQGFIFKREAGETFRSPAL
ncbi:hypothetical protein ANCCEY_05340 [Ancylostoma ceylanicum]|uniref:Peptidase A2 domain-containing protein n=1 Tax=Ancylostoma ceylanicum TaxID=53326 RepID=A0A0D6LWJ2_9BILA|nr:hypothetical protein ANCCEY_05340 [Ancylostoma ceylanicum]